MHCNNLTSTTCPPKTVAICALKEVSAIAEESWLLSRDWIISPAKSDPIPSHFRKSATLLSTGYIHAHLHVNCLLSLFIPYNYSLTTNNDNPTKKQFAKGRRPNHAHPLRQPLHERRRSHGQISPTNLYQYKHKRASRLFLCSLRTRRRSRCQCAVHPNPSRCNELVRIHTNIKAPFKPRTHH